MDFVCDRHVLSRSIGWETCHLCSCRSKRLGLRFGKKEVSKHVFLGLAAEKDAEMRSDCRVLWCSWCVHRKQMDEWELFLGMGAAM